MPTYTTIPESTLSEQLTDTFGGYNHNYKIGDGEFYDMKNLTSDYYPLMGNRAARSLIQSGVFAEINCITSDGDGNLYLIGYKSGEAAIPRLYKIYKESTGGVYAKIEDMSAMSLGGPSSTQVTFPEGAEQILIFNNDLVIFPAKTRVSLGLKGQSPAQYYYWEPLYAGITAVASEETIQIRACDSEGSLISGTASAEEPSSPTDGTIWIDTSNDGIVWKKYASSQWIAMSDVYVRISISEKRSEDTAGAALFSVGDAVKISGTSELDGTHVIIKKWATANSILVTHDFVVTGVISADETMTSGELTMGREVPQMDFVVQSQNRLWGCRYQEASASSDGINEIYACKLGDATNWNVYQGISTDSYTASCGTLGRFTGAANVNGYPIFFKENCYHKVYVSSTGAHQIQDKAINGVQDGCSGSVAMVGDICYYKSRAGIVAFDGSTTYSTGDNLGDVRYTEAVGGSANDKYYISMKDSSGQWTMFAYDTSKSLWHKEDSSHALMFCSMSGDTFFVTQESNNACSINLISDYNKTDTQETAPEWEAVTGLQGYSYTGQKYISRFNLRMVLPKGSYMDIYIEYDSSGKWEHQGHIKGAGTTSFMIPVRPRRCDHFRIKLAGAGDVRLYSMSKLFEGGTDVR